MSRVGGRLWRCAIERFSSQMGAFVCRWLVDGLVVGIEVCCCDHKPFVRMCLAMRL